MPLLPILLESVMTNGYIAVQQIKPSQANMIIAICSALCWYLTLRSLQPVEQEWLWLMCQLLK